MQGSILEACRTTGGEEEGRNSFLSSTAYEKEVGNIPVPSNNLFLRSGKSLQRANISGTLKVKTESH